MTRDERGARGEGSSGRPDPRYIRQLEEDLRRSGDDSEYGRRMAQSRSRAERATAAERRRFERRTARRLRRIAAAVLLVAALLIAIVGLQIKDSAFGAAGEGRSTPFSLLPLDAGRVTSTTEPITTSTTSTSLPTSTTTTDTAASVGVALWR